MWSIILALALVLPDIMVSYIYSWAWTKKTWHLHRVFMCKMKEIKEGNKKMHPTEEKKNTSMFSACVFTIRTLQRQISKIKRLELKQNGECSIPLFPSECQQQTTPLCRRWPAPWWLSPSAPLWASAAPLWALQEKEQLFVLFVCLFFWGVGGFSNVQFKNGSSTFPHWFGQPQRDPTFHDLGDNHPVERGCKTLARYCSEGGGEGFFHFF